MLLIDSHTHIYLEDFDSDRTFSVKKALEKGVKYQFLPNIDAFSADKMLRVCSDYPETCFPMMGLHPTSVKPGFENLLTELEKYFLHHRFVAIGETGMDLYWDKKYMKEQENAFIIQMEWAVKYKLPLVIHSRNSLNEIVALLKNFHAAKALTGVFHCFPGSVIQAQQLTEMGFYIGIGGVVTYKNSAMSKVAEAIDLNHILLETDAPYLPPVPYRGQRNESAYIYEIAEFVARMKNISVEKVAETTSRNALSLFNIDNFKLSQPS